MTSVSRLARRPSARSVLKIFVALALAGLLWILAWPTQLGGGTAYLVVAGESMEPTYESGDLIITRTQPSYGIGDIVAYRTDEGLVVHRIVDTAPDDGFVLQGDNNNYLDQWTPTAQDIVGAVQIHIPQAGDWVLRARHVLLTPPFPYVLAAFVFLAFAVKDDEDESDTDSTGADRRGSDGPRPEDLELQLTGRG